MFDRTLRAAVPLIMLCGFAATAQAVPKEGATDAQIQQTLRKAQGVLRQLNEEKTALEAKTAEQQAKIAELEARVQQLTPLENEVLRQKAGLEALQGQNEALRQRVEGDGERIRSQTERLRRTLETLKRHRQDNRLLVGAVSERERWIEECGKKNRGLVEADRAMLERFAERDWWDRLKAIEPVTGIGQVERENAAQEYAFKLEDLQVTPWQTPAGETRAPVAERPRTETDDEDDDEAP